MRYEISRVLRLSVVAALALAGCGEGGQPGAADGAATNRIDGHTVQLAAGGNRILPQFGGTKPTAAAADLPATTVPPPPPGAAPASAAAGGGGATLPDGEYACYGSGMQVLAGLGFKVKGGGYTDLDGRNAGTVTVDGKTVVFTGGHMSEIGGGRDYNGKSFRVGSMASCEKW